MDPRVRELYQRFIHIGRDYPGGLAYVRPYVKRAFFRNKDVHDEIELKRAIGRGRYMCREMIAVIQLKKFRAMKNRYETRLEQEQRAKEAQWLREAGVSNEER